MRVISSVRSTRASCALCFLVTGCGSDVGRYQEWVNGQCRLDNVTREFSAEPGVKKLALVVLVPAADVATGNQPFDSLPESN